MNKKIKYFLLLFFVAVFGCREVFDFDYDEVPEGRVVIDGFISDRGTSHVVRVSYSTTINERDLVETRFVSDATVRVHDDQGRTTQLTYDRAGMYKSAPLFRAEEGRSYQLEVVMPNGEVYESAMKSLPPPSPARAEVTVVGDTRTILSNNQVADERGARATSRVQQDGQVHYYQWLVGRLYVHNATQAFDEDLQFCYVRDLDLGRVQLLKDAPASPDQATAYDYELDFIPVTAKMDVEYGVEARLLTLNLEDFEFWDFVRGQIENTGGLFDAAPFSIRGNITNSATGEQALGYFGVYRESVDRYFFQYAELGFPAITVLPCITGPGAQVPNQCTDCRLFETQENYGINRPAWWTN